MNGTRDFRSERGGGARRRTGVVLPTVLVIMLTVCLVTGLVARFSIRSMRLARRALDVERAFVVAEAGLGYGVMRVRNMLNAELVSGLQRDYATISAPASPDPEFQLSLKIVLGEGTNEVGSLEVGSQYVTVYAGARNLESGVSCALKQTLLAESKTLSDYAAFWDGDFEANVNKDVPMHFIGKVHANGDVFVSKGAQFDRNLTCSGRFYHQRKNTGSRDDSNGNNSWRQVKILRGDDNVMSPSDKDAQGKNGLKNTWDPNKKQFVDSLLGAEWSTERTRYYGDAVKTGDDGVRSITPPLAVGEDNHALIEKPVHPGEEGYDEATESQKFSRKAALYLKVDAWGGVKLYKGVNAQGYPTDEITGLNLATPVVVSNYVSSYEGNNRWQRNKSTKHKVRIYGKDETGAYDLSDGNGFINSEWIYASDPKTFFVDKRIQWVMKPVDIYLDRLLDKNINPEIRNILDNAEANGKEKILYVEMDTPVETPVARFNRNSPTDDNPEGTDSAWTTRNDWLEPIPCVRIRNGSDLKGCDLSIVTSRHLYVEGDFNTRRNGTETSEVGENGLANALLAGDTLTTLSRNWQQYHFDPNFSYWEIDQNKHFKWDPEAAKALKFQNDTAQNKYIYRILESWQEKDSSPYTYPDSEYQKGVTTTVNSMVMMGMIPSLPPEVTGNTDADFYYSGGMENAFRWIEKWAENGSTKNSLIFNGTILCLYAPHEYEYRWEYWTKSKGSYVNWWQAPLRTSWAYRRMTPPGLPNFFSVRETDWDRVAWSSVDWGDADDGG